MNKFWFILASIFAIGIFLFWLGYYLIGVGLLALIAVLVLVITIQHSWFSCRDWRYRTSDDKTRWEKYFNNNEKKPTSWDTPNQKQYLFYEIDLREERKVIEVHFSDGGVNKVPLESRIWFQRSIQSHELTKFPDNGKHPYKITKTSYTRLKEAIPAQYIKMEMLEPDMIEEMPKSWRVEAVYVRIKTLFGLEYTIGKSWLDKL